jgi:hypothetical protein
MKIHQQQQQMQPFQSVQTVRHIACIDEDMT